MASTAVEGEPHFAHIANALQTRNVVMFLGAGVNLAERGAGQRWRLGDNFLPSGPELAEHLAERFGYPIPPACSKPRCPDPRLTRRLPGLLEVSQYAKYALGTPALYDELHDLFAASYSPTLVHRLVAQLAMQRQSELPPPAGQAEPSRRRQVLLLTTNYDDVLEKTLDLRGQPYDLVWYQADPDRSHADRRFWYRAHGKRPVALRRGNKDDPDRFERRPIVVKLHGAIAKQREEAGLNDQDESFVITEDHYIDYLALRNLDEMLPLGLTQKLARSHFLFLGYGLADWNMRVILQRIWAGQRLQGKHWAVLMGPSDVERERWAEHGVKLLDAPLATFVSTLSGRLGLALEG